MALAMPVAARAEPPATASAGDEAMSAFERLATLVGTWRVADKPALVIRFSLVAGGSVLVESWEKNGQPHSLTIYHRDGADLIATHYCPQGNQPRLALHRAEVDAGPLRFAFRDATDLDPASEEYLHDLAFDLSDPTHIVRSEIYRAGERALPSTITLMRAEP